MELFGRKRHASVGKMPLPSGAVGVGFGFLSLASCRAVSIRCNGGISMEEAVQVV